MMEPGGCAILHMVQNCFHAAPTALTPRQSRICTRSRRNSGRASILVKLYLSTARAPGFIYYYILKIFPFDPEPDLVIEGYVALALL